MEVSVNVSPEASSPAQASLKDKTVLITGANTGLGLELSVFAAKDGARVIMACRNHEKAERAKAKVLKRTKVDPEKIVLVSLDLASLESVKTFRERFTDSSLDVLICNAGIMMCPYAKTKDGVESQFGVNVLGHYALIQVLKDLLVAAPAGRLVITSSLGARVASGVNFEDLNREKSYNSMTVYCESKLCNLLMVHKFNRLMKEEGKESCVAVASHPGYSRTELGRSLTGASIYNAMLAQSPKRGALPSYLAAAQASVKPGDYCGPNGYFESRGSKAKWNCRQNKKAFDEKLQDELWAKCAELSGV